MENFTDMFDQVLIDSLGIDKAQISPDAKFREDLGADSLTMIEIIMEFENKFKLSIPDDVIQGITTVKDAQDYLKNSVVGSKEII